MRYTRTHTTALCSPSRSCVLTGRNHHANATAAINELATGYPGYNGQIPFENGFLPEILQQHGYNTYMVGKYHLLPPEFESAAGPFDRWPLGRGFERFYGFLGGDTSQWAPELVYDNHQIEPPRSPEEGYHLTEDLVDKAIEFIADAKQIAPHKPFYLHFCPYRFWPGTQTVPFFAGPRVLNRPHAITADATISAGGTEGVLLCQSTAVGGWTFYIKDGHLHYAHNCVRRAIHRVSSPDPIPEGRHELRFEFETTGAPDIPNGKASRGERNSTSTASWWPRTTCQSRSPSSSTPAV